MSRNASGSTAGVERNSFRSSAAGMSGGTSSPWSAGPTRLTLPPRRGSHNSAWGRATHGSAAPGLRSSNDPSPEGAKQGRCLVLCRPFRACQTRRLDSQGVALGWFVGAPSGRKNRAFLGRGASASRTLPLVMCNFRCGHYGLALSSSREKNLVRLRRGLSGLIVWPLDRCASEFYGEIAADLRRRGRPMQVIDMLLLAAVARSLGDCTVVTTDSDLLAIPGLSVENWDVTLPS